MNAITRKRHLLSFWIRISAVHSALSLTFYMSNLKISVESVLARRSVTMLEKLKIAIKQTAHVILHVAIPTSAAAVTACGSSASAVPVVSTLLMLACTFVKFFGKKVANRNQVSRLLMRR